MMVDLDSLWKSESGSTDPTCAMFGLEKENPEFIKQSLSVFRRKMKQLLEHLKSSVCPSNGSSSQLEMYQAMKASLGRALQLHSETPSCIRTLFALKYAHASMTQLSDLLNKNLVKLEQVYTDYARQLTDVFKRTSAQLQRITPDTVLNPKRSHFSTTNTDQIKQRRNNFLDTSANHPVNSLSNGRTYLPVDSLQLFKQGHVPSLRSLLDFVLTPLQQSLSRHSAEFMLLEPLYQDTLHKQTISGAKVWDGLVGAGRNQEFLKKQRLFIPLLSKAGSGIGSMAFICRDKAQEAIEIFSPNAHENLHLKNSAFYFLR